MSKRFAVNIFHFITRVTPYFWHLNVRLAKSGKASVKNMKQNLRSKRNEIEHLALSSCKRSKCPANWPSKSENR